MSKIELSEDVLERLRDPHGYMRRRYREEIELYQQGDKRARLLIAATFPEVAEYVVYLDAQQSVVDARRSAQANEGNIVIF